MRHWIFYLALIGLTWSTLGCGDDSNGPSAPGTAPSGAKVPGPEDAGIDLPKKSGARR